MYTKQKFKTKGITLKVPLEIQNIIWCILSNYSKNNNNIDYLQIFKINICQNKKILQINHYQETPYYEETHLFKFPYLISEDINNLKIYIIDNGNYQIMLLTDEY